MKAFIISILSIMIFSCTTKDTYQRLERIDDLLTRNLLDSASIEIKKIDRKDIGEESLMAYYNLLKSEFLFRQDVAMPNDSLIDFAINYYKKNGNDTKKARALYLKGRLAYGRGNKKDGISFLKQAEIASHSINDDYLKGRIYINLASANMSINEFTQALILQKKALFYAEKTKRADFIELCMMNIGNNFGCQGQTDSAFAYINKCIPLLDYLPKGNKAVLLGNIGAAYEAVDARKSKEYVLKSIAIEPHDFTYHILAALYLREDSTTKAKECWRKALSLCKGTERKISIIEDIYEYEKGVGRYDKATALADTLQSLRMRLASEQRIDSIKSVQDYYAAMAEIDEAVEAEHYNTVIVGLGLLVFIVAPLTTLYIRKRKAYRRQGEELSKKTDKENKAQKKLQALTRKVNTIEEKKDTEAQKRIDEWKQTLANGYKLLEDIKVNDAKTVKWTKKDMNDFVAYYCTTHPTFSNKLEKDYKKLTTDQCLFLILCDMGMDDKQVMSVTGVSIAALRMKKMRINKMLQPSFTLA